MSGVSFSPSVSSSSFTPVSVGSHHRLNHIPTQGDSSRVHSLAGSEAHIKIPVTNLIPNLSERPGSYPGKIAHNTQPPSCYIAVILNMICDQNLKGLFDLKMSPDSTALDVKKTAIRKMILPLINKLDLQTESGDIENEDVISIEEIIEIQRILREYKIIGTDDNTNEDPMAVLHHIINFLDQNFYLFEVEEIRHFNLDDAIEGNLTNSVDEGFSTIGDERTITKKKREFSISLCSQNGEVNLQDELDKYFNDDSETRSIIYQKKKNGQYKEYSQVKSSVTRTLSIIPSTLILQIGATQNIENQKITFQEKIRLHAADDNKHYYLLKQINCHTGYINSGHEYSYLERAGQWFLSDDMQSIRKANLVAGSVDWKDICSHGRTFIYKKVDKNSFQDHKTVQDNFSSPILNIQKRNSLSEEGESTPTSLQISDLGAYSSSISQGKQYNTLYPFENGTSDHPVLTANESYFLYIVSTIIFISSSTLAGLGLFKWNASSQYISASLMVSGASFAPIFDQIVVGIPFACEKCTFGHSVKEVQALVGGSQPQRVTISEIRRDAYKWLSGFSYPLLFLTREIFLNYFPEKKSPEKNLALTSFSWLLGLHLGKDVLYRFLDNSFNDPPSPPRKKPDPNLAWTCSVEDEKDLPTCCFRTRDYSHLRKTALSTYIAALATLQLVYRLYMKENLIPIDTVDADIIGDFLNFLSGEAIGSLMALGIDYYKESLEEIWYDSRKLSLEENRDPPCRLKVLRWLDEMFAIFSSPLIGAFLGAPTLPGSVLDHVTMIGTGCLYGSRQFISRKQFEGYHKRKISIFSDPMGEHVGKQKKSHVKIKNTVFSTGVKTNEYITRKIIPMIAILVLLGYLLYAGLNYEGVGMDKERHSIQLWVFSSCALLGFLITHILDEIFRPHHNTRPINEMSFQFLYSPMNFTIFYQYLSQIVNIYKKDFKKDSISLYVYRQFGYAFLGAAMGNNFATLAHEEWGIPTTHPLTTQDLGNIAMRDFFG